MTKVDRKDIGNYSPKETAHYLHVPHSTLRAWIFGLKGQTSFKPVIEIADKKKRLLSFNNLVELHMLSAIRKEHEIDMPRVRKALKYVQKELGSDRPLLTEEFYSDGLDLFIETYFEGNPRLINVSQQGQLAIKSAINQYLQRVERDSSGIPIKLYPFSRHAGQEDHKQIVIDPEVAYGRPVLVGTAIPTSNIFERFLAGEPIEELAQDFCVNSVLIQEAIRCEQISNTA